MRLARKLVRGARRLRRRWLFARGGIEAINRLLLVSTAPAPILRQFGAKVGPGNIHGPLVIHNASGDYSNLKIGNRVHVGRDVFLDLTSLLTIEDEATISMRTTILTHQDVGDRSLAERYPRKEGPTTVGAGSYIGANATILCGCDIGQEAIVGAGAVVVRAVPAGRVVTGVPAKE
jgi:acetyltransferase-like isoleucine patch superfamily enzyme